MVSRRTPRLGHNLVASFGGRGWSALVQLLSVPAVLHLLGLEAFGIVGIYLALAGLLGLLDLGLGTALNREFATRRDGSPADSAAMSVILVRLELFFWIGTALLALAVSFALPAIGDRWLQPASLSGPALSDALHWAALATASQFPIALYVGGFLGLERQVELNGWLATFSTLRALGSVFVLWAIEPSLPVYFAWIAAINLVQCGVLALRIRQVLAPPLDVAPAPLAWRSIASFAGGVSIVALLGALLSQVDRLALSALAPLAEVGAYTLAWSAAGAILLLVAPVSAAVFPRLTRVLASGDLDALGSIYRLSCQLMTVIVAPAAFALMFFAEPLLVAWTHNPDAASLAAYPAAVLAAGSLLNALAHLPWQLQLAAGWTRLALGINVAAVFVVAPLTVALAATHGSEGAAWGWLALNSLYIAVGVPLMHRRLLRGYGLRWLLVDTAAPAAAAATVLGGACAISMDTGLSASGIVLVAVAAAAVAMAASLLAAPALRALLVERLTTLRQSAT